MVRESSKHLYTGVSFPRELMDTVDKYLKEHPEQQYRSRAEFIIEAIRKKLESPWVLSDEQIDRLPEKEKERYFKELVGTEDYNLLKSGHMTPAEWVKKRGMVIDPKTLEIKKFITPPDNKVLLSIEKRLTAIENKLKK